MIVVEGLTKVYGDVVAVDDISLHVKKGDIFGLIGPNGAGKTTTIKMLTSVLPPTRGRIFISGIDLLEEPREIYPLLGYVPDFFGLYEDLTVVEYLTYFARLYSAIIPLKERRKRVEGVIDRVRMNPLRGHFVGGLSRGQRQCLVIAKTLLHDPQILIMDEPTAGLDPDTRILLRRILKDLQQAGKTVLISSHLLVDLTGFCNAIGIMRRGRLVEAGDIETLSRKYMGFRIAEMDVVQGIDAISRILERKPRVKDVVIEGTHVTLRFDGSPTDLAELAYELSLEGIKFSSFIDRQETIEDMYLKIISAATVA
ncbi:MAG: ABC transporter ATP-binding protein [Planctomycetota bacterium]|nr:MAG: ABC transporter ATP-binding protein [Planctomycetota bacterium]